MRISTGCYKIEKKKGFDTTTHYMLVFIKNGIKYFRIDHGAIQKAEDVEKDIIHYYKLKSEVRAPIEINRLSATITWYDKDGDEFKITVSNDAAMEHFFNCFPRVGKKWHIKDQGTNQD